MDDRTRALLEGLEEYIRDHLVLPEETDEQQPVEEQDTKEAQSKSGSIFSDTGRSISLEELIGDVGKTFHEVLFERISQSHMSDVEVYKRANIDRKLFSKIRNNPAYHPRKNTVLALAIALRMDIEQTTDLLSRAEYALSPSSKSDVIIRYFIEKKVYDLDLINIALYDHGQALLE